MLLPKVSVIIPCFNVSKTIMETFNSVVLQTYPNIEIIMINDGSTDSTDSILKQLSIENDNVIISSHENRGLPFTRNVGVKKSSGLFLVFLDGDDKLHPSYINRCVSEFEKDNTLNLVYTETELFEAQVGVFKLPEYSFQQLLIDNCIPATAMIRADDFRNVGMYDDSLKITEDWDLWIRYLYKYPRVLKIKDSLFYYRKRLSKDSMTDLNAKCHNVDGDNARIYIYQKNYHIYYENGFGINHLFDFVRMESKFKEKYYNVWYRKWFYKIFKNGRM